MLTVGREGVSKRQLEGKIGFLKRCLSLYSSCRFTVRLREGRHFPSSPYPDSCIPSSITSISYQSSALFCFFLSRRNLHGHIVITPYPQLNVGFILGVVYSMSLKK